MYQINVGKVLDMKTTKTETPKKSTKNINYTGLLALTVALAERASTYVFATQDNKVLWVLAVILGIDAAQKLGRMAVK